MKFRDLAAYCLPDAASDDDYWLIRSDVAFIDADGTRQHLCAQAMAKIDVTPDELQKLFDACHCTLEAELANRQVKEFVELPVAKGMEFERVLNERKTATGAAMPGALQ